MVRTKLTALACVCALALLMAPAPALAQTDAAENATDAVNPDQPDKKVADQLGDLIIHSYEYDSDEEIMTITATWRGETPETVTLVEMIQLDKGGTSEITFQQQRLVPDAKTKIEVSAETRNSGEAAVIVNTPQSIENGEALVLQAGDPVVWPTITLDNAILATGVSAAGAAGFTFLFVLRRKHDEETGIKRKA